MKKRSFVMSSVIGVGLLLVGCSGEDEEAKPAEEPTQEVAASQEEAPTQVFEHSQEEETNEKMPRRVDVDRFGEETDDPEEAFYSEFSTIKEFVTSSVNDLKEGSEYRERFAHAEQNIANATNTYVVYFNKEIEELGMVEDFEELKNGAAELIEKFGTNGEHLEGYEKTYEEFENKYNEILSKM